MRENARNVAAEGQLSKFSGIITKGLSKPKRRWVKEGKART